MSCRSRAVQHFSVLRANRPVTCQPLAWARESVSAAADTVATRHTQDAIVGVEGHPTFDSDAELRTSGPRSPRARRLASTSRQLPLRRTRATPPRRPSNSRTRRPTNSSAAPAASRGSPSSMLMKRSAFYAAPARSSFFWSRSPPGPSSLPSRRGPPHHLHIFENKNRPRDTRAGTAPTGTGSESWSPSRRGRASTNRRCPRRTRRCFGASRYWRRPPADFYRSRGSWTRCSRR